jgi:hypothetical protein
MRASVYRGKGDLRGMDRRSAVKVLVEVAA